MLIRYKLIIGDVFSGRLGILGLEDICYAIISEERCFIIVINKLDVQC